MTDGLVVVDKPMGLTSHDVVARCRRIFGQKRVGHAGTLDPDATGVLLVGLGRVTRLLRYLSVLGKSYRGEVVLGASTTTLDASGEVLATFDMSSVTLDEVRRAAQRFVGRITQVPPMVSALKVGGRRLHELARQGIEVERQPREVVVDRFDVEAMVAPGVFSVEVDCSSGTYVRALAHDLGQELGGGAHLRNLRRVAVGSFREADAQPLDQPDELIVLSPVEAMRDYPRIQVSEAAAAAVAVGRSLPRERVGLQGEGPWALIDAAGRLLAVYEAAPEGSASERSDGLVAGLGVCGTADEEAREQWARPTVVVVAR